jgi:peptidyl-tRNA hydrolase, PTH1 family
MKPMQFLFGLGNPGEKYQFSRHNVGFMVLETILAQSVGKKKEDAASLLRLQTKLFAKLVKQDNFIFAEPQTFMNESGKSVRAIIEYYDKQSSFTAESRFPHVWVIHDDLDIEVGRYKIQFGTGPKVHNGLGSIDEHLHSDQYWHVRVGVDGRQGDRSIPSQNYVLGSFSPVEKEVIEKVAAEISTELLQRWAGTE